MFVSIQSVAGICDDSGVMRRWRTECDRMGRGGWKTRSYDTSVVSRSRGGPRRRGGGGERSRYDFVLLLYLERHRDRVRGVRWFRRNGLTIWWRRKRYVERNAVYQSEDSQSARTRLCVQSGRSIFRVLFFGRDRCGIAFSDTIEDDGGRILREIGMLLLLSRKGVGFFFFFRVHRETQHIMMYIYPPGQNGFTKRFVPSIDQFFFLILVVNVQTFDTRHNIHILHSDRIRPRKHQIVVR